MPLSVFLSPLHNDLAENVIETNALKMPLPEAQREVWNLSSKSDLGSTTTAGRAGVSDPDFPAGERQSMKTIE